MHFLTFTRFFIDLAHRMEPVISMAEKINQYSDVRRPTVQLTLDEHRKISHYCIDNGIKIGDVLRTAALYCLKHKINPSEDK